MKINSYKDLNVWKLGMDIAEAISLLTEKFPAAQKFVIIPQIQRSAISIPSNIAEGYSRDGTKEYIYHISIALGSLSELETQVLLATRAGFCKNEDVKNLLEQMDVLGKMLKKLSLSLKSKFMIPPDPKSQIPNPKIVTRFAPSPTGFLHIGGARTALFSYLFAKANGGKYLLRIEDTDRERSTKEAIDAIIDGLNWLGLPADEAPIFQFARAHRHAEVAMEMVEKGHAYRCYVTTEELAKWREENPNKKFRSPFRDLNRNDSEPHVIRLKAPLEGKVTIKDYVKGEVSVDAAELDDMILLRSDGNPTYMLAVVVDDHDMGITHVIRGDDHFTNAFRQKLIYEAMGWEVPEFAHVPLIHGPDGAKLSKRHGALGVEEYRKMGYLPEAMRNYLLRLGWSHGDDEIISDAQAVEWFNLENLGSSPARFDFEKLASINLHYIKNADDKRLANLVAESDEQVELLTKAMPFLKERSNTLEALKADAKFLFKVQMDEKAAEKLKTADKAILQKLVDFIPQVNEWDKPAIEAAIHKFMEENSIKMGQVGPAIRALLTGTMQSPGIYDVMAVLGKDEVLKRLKSGL